MRSEGYREPRTAAGLITRIRWINKASFDVGAAQGIGVPFEFPEQPLTVLIEARVDRVSGRREGADVKIWENRSPPEMGLRGNMTECRAKGA